MSSAVPLSLRTSSYVKGTIFGTSLCYYKPQKEKTAENTSVKFRVYSGEFRVSLRS